jgi:hypothetical protein
MASSIHSGAQFSELLVKLFEKAGWKVEREMPRRDGRIDLLAGTGKRRYLVDLKVLPEGRRDRLLPLLAQAILQAQKAAESYSPPSTPLAVVAAPRVPPSVADAAIDFAQEYAPEVAVGVIDGHGLRSFSGQGLERFNSKPARRPRSMIVTRQEPPGLFSDLNQWLLKVLVGQPLPNSLIGVPRGEFPNGSRLAAAANVSVMTSTRFVQRLTSEGFLADVRDRLEIVRLGELLDQWASAARHTSREIPARWIIRKDVEQLYQSLAAYADELEGLARSGKASRAAVPNRCCLGLFAAADLLGFGFVRGVPPHLYMERIDPHLLRRFGLVLDDGSAGSPDAYVRIPTNPESVFRAATKVDGAPVCDVLQVWLDTTSYPTRGREQADVIRKRALGPLFRA